VARQPRVSVACRPDIVAGTVRAVRGDMPRRVGSLVLLVVLVCANACTRYQVRAAGGIVGSLAVVGGLVVMGTPNDGECAMDPHATALDCAAPAFDAIAKGSILILAGGAIVAVTMLVSLFTPDRRGTQAGSSRAN
jgi:hypothetical protein